MADQTDAEDGTSGNKTHHCFCSKYCGARGQWITKPTFYRHKKIEEEGEIQEVHEASWSQNSPQSNRGSRRRRSESNSGGLESNTDENEEEEHVNVSESQNLEPSDLNMEQDEIAPTNETPYASPPIEPSGMNVDPHPSRPNSAPPDEDNDEDAPLRPPSPTDQPQEPPSGGYESSIQEFQITNRFIEMLRTASLDDEREPLDPDFIHRLRNPPRGIPELDEDQRLSLDLFLSITSNASIETYNAVRAAVLRRHPEDSILSYHEVQKLVTELSGVEPVLRDMCINSCMAYTGPYHDLDHCPYDGEPRYDPKRRGAKVPRMQFSTFPIGPQIQALRRSPVGAEEVRYRERCTQSILDELEANDDVKESSYKDFFDGEDYVDAVRAGKIKSGDTVMFLTSDGAQLYRNKTSDMWIYAWIIVDRSTKTRYKLRSIPPGAIVPGPGKPKNLDSFLYPGLHHLAALQDEGLRVWDAVDKEIVEDRPFLALVCADGPGMAAINGCVGHHGKKACRVYCGMNGRHKIGGSHYYPARFKPHNYNVAGSAHDDLQLGPLLDGFDPEEAAVRYHENVKTVASAKNKTEYEKKRLETGISKPCIFTGLSSNHTLGLPDCFALDFMHAPCLNLTDLLIPLWRGKFDCDKTDSIQSWDWAVLTGETWKRHGQAVADIKKYIPGSFGRPPRNPAEKISSGYKAWEFLLYFYGLGPALLYGILPEAYYCNYCKVVRGVRLLLQEEITPEELVEAHQVISEFSDGFEALYVQRRADRLHFVRPVVHTMSHMPGETVRKGPGNIYSQWALERTIGNLGQEIRQHSNPYANLSKRALQRCQVNALMAIIPDLDLQQETLPRGGIVLGGDHHLLRPQDTCRRPVRACEAAAIREYIREQFDDEAAADWYPSVVRWARVRLPTGQIARCSWKEEERTNVQIARQVKIFTQRHGFELGEVFFYFILTIGEEERYVGLASVFGPPEPHLLELSSRAFWSVQHSRDTNLRVVDITDITASVMMAPDHQYALFRSDGSHIDRWFLAEKPGFKLTSSTGPQGHEDEDEDMDID